MNETKESGRAGSDRLFETLAKAMRVPEIAQRVNNHVRAKFGKPTLVAFHNNGAGEDVRKATYTECLVAIRSQDWTRLAGQDGKGQAVAPPAETEEENDKPVTAAEADPPKVHVFDAPEPAPRVLTPDPSSDPSRQLVDALRAIMGAPGQPQRVAIDEAQIQEIVISRVGEAQELLRTEMSAKVDEYLKAIPPRDVVEIRPIVGDKFEIPRQHYKFPLLMACLAQRIPVCLVGPAASSKSTAAKFAADALKLPFGASNFGPTTSKSDLFGFKDAHGAYHSTELVRTALSGGVWCGDEFDRGHAGISTMLNMPLANRLLPLPDGTKPVHDDWVPVLTANTYGTGANRLYVGANQMDAATLDRMVFIEWDYDPGLEGAIIGVTAESPGFDLAAGGLCGPAQWFDGVCRTREAIGKLGIRHLVTPRASIHGAKLLAAGVGLDHVKQIVLWKGLDAESIKKIEEAMA